MNESLFPSLYASLDALKIEATQLESRHYGGWDGKHNLAALVRLKAGRLRREVRELEQMLGQIRA